MKIPTFLLKDTISLEKYAGSGAHGPVYDGVVSVKAVFQDTTKLITNLRGVVVAASAAVLIRPEDGPVPVESRATVRSVVYRVASANPFPNEVSPYYWELLLDQYAA